MYVYLCAVQYRLAPGLPERNRCVKLRSFGVQSLRIKRPELKTNHTGVKNARRRVLCRVV
jgi:hypothetical protein